MNLCLHKPEVVGCVPLGDDEGVPLGDWKAITNDIRKFVLCNDALTVIGLDGAEEARFTVHASESSL